MLSFLFENVLNNRLKFNPNLAKNLNKKNIFITLLPIKTQWKINFSHEKAYCVSSDDLLCADLHITATPKALIAMLFRGDRTGLKLEGDVVLAQTLEHCFIFNHDDEAFIEDPFKAYPFMALYRKGKKKIKSWRIETQQMLSDCLQEETDCLPLPSEVKDFCDAVDELKLKVDRLEAKLKTL